jgi:tetratricopeptide (TPR) repeat protein
MQSVGIPTFGGAKTSGVLALLLVVLTAAVSAADQTSAPREELDALIRQREWKQVYRLASELSRSHPHDGLPRYYAGVAAFQLGEKVRAIQALREAEKLGLDTPFLHKALGLAYYDANQFLLFREQLERTIRLDPADHQAHFHLGRYYESVRNDFPAAIVYFDRALDSRPGDPKTLYFKGYCLQVLGKAAAARRYFERAANAVADSGDRFSLPHQGLAKILNETDPDGALKWARRAVELEPGEAENHIVLAQVYRRLARTEAAATSLEEAVRLAPDNDAARFMLYQTYRELGNEPAARAELEVFKELRKAYGDQ